MNIEKLGVRITTDFDPMIKIMVDAHSIMIDGASYTRAGVIEMRDALNAALDAHAEMTGDAASPVTIVSLP